MGESKIKKSKTRKFIEQYPICCYCGRASETIDHCPPRNFFRNRQWPEGYKFPACDKCNKDARLNEQIISCLYRLSIRDDPEENENLMKMIDAVRNNSPQILSEWQSATGARRKRDFRKIFGEFGDKLRRDGFGIASVGQKTYQEIVYFGFKISRALYYYHIGTRLIGHVFLASVNHIVQRELVLTFLRMAPETSKTRRKNINLSDQFSYRYNYSPEVGVFYSIVFLGDQNCYVIFAITDNTYNDMIRQHPELRDLTVMLPEHAVFG